MLLLQDVQGALLQWTSSLKVGRSRIWLKCASIRLPEVINPCSNGFHKNKFTSFWLMTSCLHKNLSEFLLDSSHVLMAWHCAWHHYTCNATKTIAGLTYISVVSAFAASSMMSNSENDVHFTCRTHSLELFGLGNLTLKSVWIMCRSPAIPT